MERKNFTNILFPVVITFLSALVAFVSEEYRIIILSVLIAFIAVFFLNYIYSSIGEQRDEIIRLNEKLKIHKELINIKADIKFMKKTIKNE